MLEALELPAAWLPPALESPEVSGETPTACRSRPAPATRRRARSASASTSPGPLSVVLGTSGVVFAALPGFAPDPEARVHAFCHAVPGGWHAMGVMLSAAGSLALAARRARAGRVVRRAARRGRALGARRRGPPLPALPRRRADAARRSRRARRLRRPLAAARPRRARPRRARGRRLRAARLARAAARARRRGRGGRASGGGARSELWLRIVASVLDLPLERTAVEEGAAYGAALLGGVAGGVFADVHEAVAACVRVRDRSSPIPTGALLRGRVRPLPHPVSSPTSNGGR